MESVTVTVEFGISAPVCSLAVGSKPYFEIALRALAEKQVPLNKGTERNFSQVLL